MPVFLIHCHAHWCAIIHVYIWNICRNIFLWRVMMRKKVIECKFFNAWVVKRCIVDTKLDFILLYRIEQDLFTKLLVDIDFFLFFILLHSLTHWRLALDIWYRCYWWENMTGCLFLWIKKFPQINSDTIVRVNFLSLQISMSNWFEVFRFLFQRLFL